MCVCIVGLVWGQFNHVRQCAEICVHMCVRVRVRVCVHMCALCCVCVCRFRNSPEWLNYMAHARTHIINESAFGRSLQKR